MSDYVDGAVGHKFADGYLTICAEAGHNPDNDPIGKSILSTYGMMDILEEDLLWRIAALADRVETLEEKE